MVRSRLEGVRAGDIRTSTVDLGCVLARDTRRLTVDLCFVVVVRRRLGSFRVRACLRHTQVHRRLAVRAC